MKREELIKLKKMYNQELERRTRINQLLKEDNVLEYLKLNGINLERFLFNKDEDKISYLSTLAGMSTKFNEIAMKYSQASKDFSGVPLIYRQLLDQLLLIPSERLPRLKLIPKLVDLPEDIWNRIVEIANIKE